MPIKLLQRVRDAAVVTDRSIQWVSLKKGPAVNVDTIKLYIVSLLRLSTKWMTWVQISTWNSWHIPTQPCPLHYWSPHPSLSSERLPRLILQKERIWCPGIEFVKSSMSLYGLLLSGLVFSTRAFKEKWKFIENASEAPVIYSYFAKSSLQANLY